MRKISAFAAAVLVCGTVITTVPVLRTKNLRADETELRPPKSVEPDGSVKIDEDHFWDEPFREVVKEFDTNHDDKLSPAEMQAVTSIYCINMGVTDLDGIEYFTELEELHCGFNDLRTIDISQNTKLELLECENAKLTSLDVSHNPELSYIWCADNKLTSIDLTHNPKLVSFVAQDNLLTEIDVSHNPELLDLFVNANRLTSLDISKNTKLGFLGVSYNPITSLDISNQPELVECYCFGCEIAKLDASNHAKLCVLSVAENPMSEVRVDGCPYLLNLFAVAPLQLAKDPYGGNEYYYSYFVFDQNGELIDCVFYMDATTKLITEKPADPAPVDPVPVDPQPADPVKAPSFEDFIERLYKVALNRDSDPSGKTFWMNKVLNEGFTGADCARGFLIESPEFGNRGLNDDQFLTVLYKTFFDRDPDQGGYAFWKQKIAEGMTREQVIEGFIDATEWCNLCAKYGVKSGAKNAKATTPSDNAVKFATRLYTECLGREPDASGLSHWALLLTNCEKTGYEAAKDFFSSAEFLGKNTSDDVFIHLLYRTFMGRDEDADGFAFWKKHLGTDMTRDDLIKGFAKSQEFTNICNQYGIVKGI